MAHHLEGLIAPFAFSAYLLSFLIVPVFFLWCFAQSLSTHRFLAPSMPRDTGRAITTIMAPGIGWRRLYSTNLSPTLSYLLWRYLWSQKAHLLPDPLSGHWRRSVFTVRALFSEAVFQGMIDVHSMEGWLARGGKLTQTFRLGPRNLTLAGSHCCSCSLIPCSHDTRSCGLAIPGHC